MISHRIPSAGASDIHIDIIEENDTLTFRIEDNGKGMTEDFLANVLDPFTTTRTTRKVGLGLPLLKMAAEATGGGLTISSKHEAEHADHGTVVTAVFHTDHIDCLPLGDMTSTVVTLLQSAPFEPRYVYRHIKNGISFELDTDELHSELGPDIPLSEPAVLDFIASYVSEGEESLEQ